MTDYANTVEEQLRELKSQYQHAANIIREQTQLAKEHMRETERQDRLINALRLTITDLECKLSAAQSPPEGRKCGGGGCDISKPHVPPWALLGGKNMGEDLRILIGVAWAEGNHQITFPTTYFNDVADHFAGKYQSGSQDNLKDWQKP